MYYFHNYFNFKVRLTFQKQLRRLLSNTVQIFRGCWGCFEMRLCKIWLHLVHWFSHNPAKCTKSVTFTPRGAQTSILDGLSSNFYQRGKTPWETNLWSPIFTFLSLNHVFMHAKQLREVFHCEKLTRSWKSSTRSEKSQIRAS